MVQHARTKQKLDSSSFNRLPGVMLKLYRGRIWAEILKNMQFMFQKFPWHRFAVFLAGGAIWML